MRLILVSNREPWICERSKKGVFYRKAIGGLVSSLDQAIKLRGGLWIAWGSGSDDFIQGDIAPVPPDNPKYQLKRIKLSEREIERYYRGFSNGVLWPFFHIFLERVRFDRRLWEYYQKVNQRFAKTVVEMMKPDDMVWVHDYHLALVPQFIREMREDARIAFFWHIPWVDWDVFNKLPWRRELIRGLLGSDFIGFHTREYVTKFIRCAKKLGFSIVGKEIIKQDNRKAKIGAFPLGIDNKIFKASIRDVNRLKKKINAEKIIIGVDRLDYTKGILQRLWAFERFLEKYPKFRGKVSLVQIASPSRTKVGEYRRMKRDIDENVGRINGTFRRMDWTPVIYLYRTFPQSQLSVFYKAADVALVTPLMDGMNLVAKEYMAAREDGVLILSEFAGAAEDLKEAIIVNPYDIERVADAIKDALELLPFEKNRRAKALRKRIKKRDINWWLNSFLYEWGEIYGIRI